MIKHRNGNTSVVPNIVDTKLGIPSMTSVALLHNQVLLRGLNNHAVILYHAIIIE